MNTTKRAAVCAGSAPNRCSKHKYARIFSLYVVALPHKMLRFTCLMLYWYYTTKMWNCTQLFLAEYLQKKTKNQLHLSAEFVIMYKIALNIGMQEIK